MAKNINYNLKIKPKQTIIKKQLLNTIDEKEKIIKLKDKIEIKLLTVSIPKPLLSKFEVEAQQKLWKKSTLMKVILEERYGKNNSESENQ